MTEDVNEGSAADGLRFELPAYSEAVARLRRQIEERVAADLDRMRAEARARMEEQRQQARDRQQQAVLGAHQRIGQTLSQRIGRSVWNDQNSAVEQALFRVIAEHAVKMLQLEQTLTPPSTGDVDAGLPALQMSASGTVSLTGTADMQVVKVWPGTWSRKTTKLVLQYYLAFVTFVVVGCWVDERTDLADELSLWTGGGVFPAALGAWKLVGWVFDQMYPPSECDES